jgi:bifunctional UDP-N-acetylglucosamine pyrophosphorylase/glucosamine-1-phosphate N-acetyltransferase
VVTKKVDVLASLNHTRSRTSGGAVILAAGKGTRMNSPYPKVLFKLCGRPLLEWVVKAVRGAGIERILVVVGSHKGEVAKEVERLGAEWVEQSQQLGTGHALKVASPLLRGSFKDVLVLYGDAPLVRDETLSKLYKHHCKAQAEVTLLTTCPEDPAGYGRIIRDGSGRVTRIVEEVDLTEEQRRTKEVNAGIYCFKVDALSKALEGLTTENNKGEYYLTQVVEILNNNGGKVEAVPVANARELLGVNSQADLTRLSLVVYEETLRHLMDNGITVLAPSNTFVEEGAEIGQGTVLYPFTYISKGVTVGKGCRVGPFVCLKEGTMLGDGTEIGPNL